MSDSGKRRRVRPETELPDPELERLRDAAPELLHALESFLSLYLPSYGDFDLSYVERCIVEEGRAAVAKAKGKAKGKKT